MSFYLRPQILHDRNDNVSGGRDVAPDVSSNRTGGMSGVARSGSDGDTEESNSDFDTRNYRDATGGDGPGGSPSNADMGGASVPGGRDQS